MRSPPSPVIPLEGRAVPAVAAAAARALRDDPMFAHIFPQEAGRQARLERFLRPALRYGRRYGEAYTTPDHAGAVVWIRPGHPAPTLPGMVRSGLAALPLTLGLPAFRRFLHLTGHFERLHARLLPGPHWFGLLMGVEPRAQGRGLGLALARPVLARADAEGLPCYLETTTERNARAYERYGFRVVHEGPVPGTTLRVWVMVRPPGVGSAAAESPASTRTDDSRQHRSTP